MPPIAADLGAVRAVHRSCLIAGQSVSQQCWQCWRGGGLMERSVTRQRDTMLINHMTTTTTTTTLLVASGQCSLIAPPAALHWFSPHALYSVHHHWRHTNIYISHMHCMSSPKFEVCYFSVTLFNYLEQTYARITQKIFLQHDVCSNFYNVGLLVHCIAYSLF